MAPTYKAIAFSVVSAGLGAFAFYKTQTVSSAMFEPIMAACLNLEIKVEDFAEKTGYHAYDPIWGFGFFNVFVCLITQFLHALVAQSPAGAVAWFTTMIVFLPVHVLITLEAGRGDAKGPLRYPLIVDVLNQVFGVSVLFPLVWVPSYIWGHGEGGLSQTRIYASVPIAVPRLLLSIVIFWLLPTSSSWWTSCAAIVGGPAVCLPLALLYFVQHPDPNDLVVVQTSAEKSTMPYAVTGVISLAAWLWLVFIVTIPHYGFRLSAIYKDVWGEADPAVAFMTIDAIVLWLGLIVFIAYHKFQSGLEALALSFLFGPGAGPALVLAGLQVDDEAQLEWAMAAQEQRKADEEKKKNE
jgi:hypothetical protein